VKSNAVYIGDMVSATVKVIELQKFCSSNILHYTVFAYHEVQYTKCHKASYHNNIILLNNKM